MPSNRLIATNMIASWKAWARQNGVTPSEHALAYSAYFAGWSRAQDTFDELTYELILGPIQASRLRVLPRSQPPAPAPCPGRLWFRLWNLKAGPRRGWRLR